jgi:hypothetical protein
MVVLAVSILAFCVIAGAAAVVIWISVWAALIIYGTIQAQFRPPKKPKPHFTDSDYL